MRTTLIRLVAPTVLALVGAVAFSAPAQAMETSPSGDPALQGSCNASGTFCYYADNGFLNFLGQSSGAGTSSTPTTISSVRNRTGSTWCVYKGTLFTGEIQTVSPNTEIAQVGTTWGSSWNDAIRSVRTRPTSGC